MRRDHLIDLNSAARYADSVAEFPENRVRLNIVYSGF